MLDQIPISDVPKVTADEAHDMTASGRVLFVDVRKPEHFARIRIADAISVPFRGPAERFWQLPRDRDIIIY